MTTGSLCSFTGDGFHIDDGDKIRRFPNGLLPLSTAMAASSAFPPLFPPLRLSRKDVDATVQQFPYEYEYLTDGGVFDNLGIRHAVTRIDESSSVRTVLVSDASAAFDWDTERAFSTTVARTVRATDILMKRVAELEEEYLRRSTDRSRRFVTLSIGDVVERRTYPHALDANLQRKLRKLRTDFDAFHRDEINCLIRHGYEVAFQAVNKLNQDAHDEALPLPAVDKPVWTPFLSEPTSRLQLVVNRIDRGRVRRWSLWNRNDPMSWALLTSVIAVLLAPSLSVFVLRQDIQQERAAVEAERRDVEAVLNQLYTTVRLNLATTRAESHPSRPIAERFGVQLGSQLKYARADVSIPQTHQLGALERPSIFNLYRSDPETEIVVRQVDKQADLTTDDLTANPDGRLFPMLVYVHGWNMSFADSVRRAAATAYDLGVKGPTLLFAWPSAGTVSAYLTDTDNAFGSVSWLADVLERLLAPANSRELDIIATDMGARIAVEAIARSGIQPLRLRNLILIAPDMNVGQFREHSRALSQRASKTTIYVDPESAALKAAELSVNSPRLGASAIELPYQNVDFVEVRAGPSSGNRPNRGTTAALSDVFRVLQGSEPATRFKARTPSGAWILEF